MASQQSVAHTYSADTILVSTVHATFSTQSTSIQLDSSGQGTVSASAIADDSAGNTGYNR